MRSANPRTQIETFARVEDLPEDTAPLFETSTTFFSTRAWWRTVLAHAIPPGAVPRLLLIRRDGAPGGLFPMIQDCPAGGFCALTTPYTCLYEPLIARTGTSSELLFAAFARYCRAFPTVRLDALDQASEPAIARGGKQAGLAVARFDHFGNWHEDVTGLDWTAWLGRRPGALRETIRRRTRRAERLTQASFSLYSGQHDLEGGITAFETVYARSWKEPEPFPSFNPAQIRAAATLGLARLGIWSVGGTPAAAQFWIVERRRAMVLKLAHDEAFKAHSPGTVLTAWMIRQMIEQEHVTEIDFGRGDDPYKEGWVTSRRQRIGLMLINPLRPSGMIALGRHTMGRIKARLRPTA
jgi:CelD/BcsL family acetyltransferase involved in cellulose biosynthesis